MTLASAQFLVFLAAVYLVWRYVLRRAESRHYWLLFVSYIFYATWDIRFLGILLLTTVVQWMLGDRIHSAQTLAARKGWLAVSVAFALTCLGYFKYAGFFVAQLNELLAAVNVSPVGPIGQVLAPIGISFYTFQSLTYTIDIYRRHERPTRRLGDFALFVAFFGHVTAGPISRARLLVPQIERLDEPNAVLHAQALFLLVRGFIKKIAIADVLFEEFVGPAFATPGEWSSLFLVIVVFAYSFQIYMDISGYTDIARGSARCFGYDLAINFDRPYLSQSVSNFWQRWHMSMSSFFRDYLYFSLGGSRKGNVYINLMLTFVAIGFWHGAGWNFIVYGALHGGMVCWERWRRGRRAANGLVQSAAFLWVAKRVLLTFFFVSFCRVLFVAADLPGAFDFFRAMAGSAGEGGAAGLRGYTVLMVAIGLHFLPRNWEQEIASWFFGWRPALQALAWVGVVVVLIAVGGEPRQFVYFNF